MPKRVHIKTYGCQMNVHDSERMGETLAREGFEAVGEADDADLVVINTCHIREKAAEKVYSDVGRLRSLRARNPGLVIAVAGCTAQAEGAEILARAPMVDLVVGPQAYHDLPALLARVAKGERVVHAEFPREDKFDHLPPRRAHGRATAFLTVQEGCDKFCAFCVVPYTRGSEQSRPLARMLDEARALVGQGVREVTLLGQNVNAWHGEGGDGFAGLVAALARIEGLERIRYTTSHPRDMDDELIAIHGAEPKLMPVLHLPVQSGSDRILAAMNRGHNAALYLDVVGRLRAARPDILLTSDFIVGFPGETEADFLATLDLVRSVGFGNAYCFAYSARPGTPAAEGRRGAIVPTEVAHERLLRLQALVAVQAGAALDAIVGRHARVLFEKAGRDAGQVTGRCEHQHPVHALGGPEVVGTIREVRIVARTGNSLDGEIVG